MKYNNFNLVVNDCKLTERILRSELIKQNKKIILQLSNFDEC